MSPVRENGRLWLQLWHGNVTETQGEGAAEEKRIFSRPYGEKGFADGIIYIKVSVNKNGNYSWSYSDDGIDFGEVPSLEKLTAGTWTGARLALFVLNRNNTVSGGYGDFDSIRFYK